MQIYNSSVSNPLKENTSIPGLTPQAQYFDAIVVGAGLGGLLSAASLLQQNKRVVVLERLPHSGGRFTAKTLHGVQVSTGAVHMVPFGSSGVLAHLLQRLHVPHYLFDADVFGSFHVRGKQYRSRGLLAVSRFLGARQFLGLIYIGYLLFVKKLSPGEQELSFDTWFRQKLSVKRYHLLYAFFECISCFALSLRLKQVSVIDVACITKNMLRYGAPAIVQGGCGELTKQLEQHISVQGGAIRLSCEVLQLLQADGHILGVRVRNKSDATETLLFAPLVVSDIGPRATMALLESRKVTQADVLKRRTNDEQLHEAVGLKIHILSDVSLIPHKGIMYCLDTQRIAGMVQPTNSDPALAPAGKHLLISHQVIQSDNVEEERALALADLRKLFGADFEKHCHIITMGTYRGEWPVNRLAQGEDMQPQTTVQGLYLVGDAVKPQGYLMVEGVAQSVNQFLDLLDRLDNGKHEPFVMMPPSRWNALRWLWQAPGNSNRSRSRHL